MGCVSHNRRSTAAGAFSLAELLVVLGVVALLIAITLPPLQLARRQARQTLCAVRLHTLGKALEDGRSEFRFYPLWDDNGSPTRYTWIDVLIQLRYLREQGGANGGAGGRGAGLATGYCPADRLPDLLNEARHPTLTYPLDRNRNGVDYSYGIGVPLSAGGWKWSPPGERTNRPRRFLEHERNVSSRVLAGDGYDSMIYNLSGRALRSGIWNDPTQFDNTVAWGRHGSMAGEAPAANLLFQDGHVANQHFDAAAEFVNTSRTFLWYPGEPVGVGPEDQWGGQYYPNQPPNNWLTGGSDFPDEMLPVWYTLRHAWTNVNFK